MRTLSIEHLPGHEHPASYNADRFMQVLSACKQGRVSLIPATLDSTGETVAVICGINKALHNEKPAFHLVPFAVMCNDPGEQVLTPSGEGSDGIVETDLMGRWMMPLSSLAQSVEEGKSLAANSKGEVHSPADIHKAANCNDPNGTSCNAKPTSNEAPKAAGKAAPFNPFGDAAFTEASRLIDGQKKLYAGIAAFCKFASSWKCRNEGESELLSRLGCAIASAMGLPAPELPPMKD